MSFTLLDFVRESNRIEGIDREPTILECHMHEWLLSLPIIGVQDISNFVNQVAQARLRDQVGLDVRVGDHVPPAGGPGVASYLNSMLHTVNYAPADVRPRAAYKIHHEYETLHPFTDGNGRSGRALWLWMMGGIAKAPLGFLHTWYYQSLSSNR